MAGDERPMNATSGNAPITELHQQTAQLTRTIGHLINAILTCLFSLTPRGTRRRRRMLIGVFILTGFLFGFFSQNLSVWLAHVQAILVYLFNPTVAASLDTNPLLDFFQFVLDIYKRPDILRFFSIFVLPFILAWQLAALYLADIFEEEASTARTFILQVAITGGRRRIRVREGEIDSESESSPVYLIGGPGSVIVELDSAALFELSDGRPHVIGPTTDGPVILEGFERFRQAINLRDHLTDKFSVTSRSSDGIPIQAEDVNYLFSVVRGTNEPPTAERPYPYLNDGIIETLVYNQVTKVSEFGPRPADISKDWAGTMKALIRNGLATFMTEHRLTEYLASHGDPEIQAANQQVNDVLDIARRVLPPEGPFPALTGTQNIPPFVPRPDIRAQLFGEFAEAFPGIAAQRGVELHWVGIGSWRTPSQIIPDQHLEAWQLTMENQARRERARQPNQDQTAYITGFIQDIPLTRFEECREKQKSHYETMFSLLVGYREQFMKILNIMDKKQEPVNRDMLFALRHINRILGMPDNFPAHWIGTNGNQRPPRPSGTPASGPIPPALSSGSGTRSQAQPYRSYSPEEHALFNNLLVRTHNIEVAIRLVEHERTLAPNASEIELIRRAIEHWERDNQ